MASKATISIFFLAVALTLSICTRAKLELDPNNQKLKKTNIVFYMHDWENGLNVTAKVVAGVPKEQWSSLQYGTILAIDDKLTEAYDRNSTEIGRARGIYIVSALDASEFHLLFSVVFTNKEFGGSTLEIQGSDRFFVKHRDVSVVGGTGKFALAKGIATVETAYLDLPNLNAILRFNLTVFHY